MARTSHSSHANPAGGLPDRVRASGNSSARVGENIHHYDPALGRTRGIDRHYTPGQLAEYFFDGWRVPPEQKANLLSPHAIQVGLALARAASGKIYAVLVLGQPWCRLPPHQGGSGPDVRNLRGGVAMFVHCSDPKCPSGAGRRAGPVMPR